MKEQILKIAKNLEQGMITETEAQNLLLGLFGVIKSNLNLPQSFIDKIDSWDDGGCSTGMNDD